MVRPISPEQRTREFRHHAKVAVDSVNKHADAIRSIAEAAVGTSQRIFEDMLRVGELADKHRSEAERSREALRKIMVALDDHKALPRSFNNTHSLLALTRRVRDIAQEGL